MARTKVFKDKDGNRMLIPAMIQFGSDDDMSDADIICKALMLTVAVGLSPEDGWFEFDPANLTHFETTIIHRSFQHGGATAILFEGPQFDIYNAKAASAAA